MPRRRSADHIPAPAQSGTEIALLTTQCAQHLWWLAVVWLMLNSLAASGVCYEYADAPTHTLERTDYSINTMMSSHTHAHN